MYIFKELATNFAVTDVDSGISYTLSSFLGKVVVLDLFATWCSPCAVALPYLRQLHLKYKSELFQIISIDTDNRETQAQVSQFRQDSEMDWIVSLDPDGVIDNAYGTGSIPSFYIIDQKREIY
jgi:thiol-disulfide isomerase/thioredoxin